MYGASTFDYDLYSTVRLHALNSQSLGVSDHEPCLCIMYTRFFYLFSRSCMQVSDSLSASVQYIESLDSPGNDGPGSLPDSSYGL